MDKNINPCISVIMPVFNCASYIREAIESVLQQTFTDFELFIIDDASTDNSLDIIREYKDQRIKLIVKPINTGISDSLNMAIKLATGNYIARMDGDDISLITRFEHQFQILEKYQDIVLCGSWMGILNSGEQVILPIEHDEIKVNFLNYCCIAHPTVMIRANFLKEYKFEYNSRMEPAEDFDLWTRMIKKGVFFNIAQPLVKYRVHLAQTSTKRDAIRINKSLEIKAIHLANIINLTAAKKFYKIHEIIKCKSTQKKIAYLNWLLKEYKYLVSQNDKYIFFKQYYFNIYLKDHEKTSMRYIFLSSQYYDPLLSLYFLKFIVKNPKYFSFYEVMKNLIKCIIRYRK